MSNQRRNVRNVWHKLFAWMRDRNNGVLDLYNANLYNANLYNANLEWSDLRRSNLRWSDLRGSNLRRANLQNVDLRYADLRRLNLQNADLRDADLRYAKLRGAKLESANTTIPIGMTSTNEDVYHELGTDTYGVGCYDGNVDDFITKTISVRSPQQAKQIFYRCLSFGVEDHEQMFLDAIANL